MDYGTIGRYIARVRPDLSLSVTHWTKRTGQLTAFEVLKKIINERCIKASQPDSGFIKANQRATCFTETPVSLMARLFRVVEHDQEARKFVKWEPFGLSFYKHQVFVSGGRPVLYLTDDEYDNWIAAKSLKSELAWRVVRIDYQGDIFDNVIDWTHEREWRMPSDWDFSTVQRTQRPLAIVNGTQERDELYRLYQPGDDTVFRGVLCLHDIRVS